jgi:uncharacterized protein (DUF2147 family)
MQSARRVIAAVGICLRWLAGLSVASAMVPVGGTEPGVRGYWQEPSGAVIEIAPCAEGLCLKIVALSPGEHPHTDAHNPDAKLRGRALCGLRIGHDFTQIDPQHAAGGHLYDPRSGHTYSGSMTAQGNKLKLRGYLGIQLLGRTEIWTRVGPGQASCTAT